MADHSTKKAGSDRQPLPNPSYFDHLVWLVPNERFLVFLLGGERSHKDSVCSTFTGGEALQPTTPLRVRDSTGRALIRVCLLPN